VHLMLSLNIAYLHLKKFHDFVNNSQKGMKHQMGGVTQAQQGMNFHITLIFTFYFLPWELNPSQNVKTGLVFRLNAKWELGKFSPPMTTFILVFMAVLIIGFHWLVFSENQTKNWCWFSASGWKLPNTSMDKSKT
jgi:ABC-type proline/glycine betaine transport system permease subunit